MAKYLSDIVSYFQNLCVQHPSLLHAETAGSRIFEVVAYDEAFGDFKTGASEKGYAVRLLLPTMKMEASSDNARKMYQVGLMVAKYYSTREDSKTAKITAFSAAEQVADDFVARMVYDSRQGNDLFFGSLDNVDNMGLTGDFIDSAGDGSYAAVLYLIDFATFRCLDPLGAGFADWIDL